MTLDKLDSELLRYIAQNHSCAGDRLPALDELSEKMGISVGKIREQLEVARELGLVEVKPRTGVRLAEYQFYPAIRTSLLFALSRDPHLFEQYSALRNHVEFSFFHEAAARLTAEDHNHLREIVRAAWDKLNGKPIRIPDVEHRALHLSIYKRLDNPFVIGLLEAYWEAYDAVGLNVYADYRYLTEVWMYHERIVESLVNGAVDDAYNALVQHTKLLQQRDLTEKEASPALA
jgi:DNA-binding FadR family transcriptional regulator